MFSLFRKKPLLSNADRQMIEQSIQQAESKTSGEVRVYVEPHCTKADAIDRAKEVFAQLGMEKTQARNAIIVYVAITDRKFALYGDTVIYEKAGGAMFWEKAAATMAAKLRQNKLAEGISECVLELGAALATHFPYDPNTKKNELPDEIVFGK